MMASLRVPGRLVLPWWDQGYGKPESISFDESVLQEAEQRLSKSGGSLSAFVNAAVLHELQIARGNDLLAEDDAQLGAASTDVRAQVATEWPA
jgi:hypothetical protein